MAEVTTTAGKALFAAPQTAAALPDSSVGGIGQVMLSLLIVLAAIFVAAWVVRRLRGVGGARASRLQVLAQVSLGQRERAVVLQVGAQQLLLGVTPGQVNLLQVLPEGALDEPSPATSTDEAGRGPVASALPPSFAALLKKGLGQ
jgi:flagellar biosynthetic protein FliO